MSPRHVCRRTGGGALVRSSSAAGGAVTTVDCHPSVRPAATVTPLSDPPPAAHPTLAQSRPQLSRRRHLPSSSRSPMGARRTRLRLPTNYYVWFVADSRRPSNASSRRGRPPSAHRSPWKRSSGCRRPAQRRRHDGSARRRRRRARVSVRRY